jgi:parallel beta-helix repeat protein
MTATFESADRTGHLDCSSGPNRQPGLASDRRRRPTYLLLLAAAAVASGCSSEGGTSPTPSSPALIPIYAGQSIQAKVDSYPPGTRFLIKAGVHYKQHIIPKTGNWFVGEPGTILDGRDTIKHAFDLGSGPFPDSVHVKGIVIEHYASPSQTGPILASDFKGGNASGWVIESCEIRYNEHGGIKLGDRMKVLNNFIHHNKQIGISGRGDSILVEGNEIAFNNYLKTHPFGHVLGGAKFVLTRWLTVRNNNVHDNEGHGIWTDIESIYGLVEGNVVTRNSGAGIMHEISFDITIRNNTTTGNGFGAPFITGAGILISASANATVSGNTVLDNRQGIVGIQQSRAMDGVDYSSNLKNMYVHANTVRVSPGGISGVFSGVGDLTFTSRNNRYVGNAYEIGSDTLPFYWLHERRTKAEWQSYGNDVDGTFY